MASWALERPEISYVCMRAGFPAWQQFNQRANFINPSAILRSGTSGTRYTRGRGRPGERRRVWRRTKTGGFAATISLMPGSSRRGRRFFIGSVARVRPFSENANGKLFKRHVYHHVPSQIYGRVCLCILRAHPCVRARARVLHVRVRVRTLFVPPQYRPDTRISGTRQPSTVGTSERRRCARPLSSSPCPL